MDRRAPFLVIEEEQSVLQGLQKIIARAFPMSELHSYRDGGEAWDFLQHYAEPLIILSDMRAPGINGVQLLRNVRNNAALKGSYYIMLTPSDDKEANLKSLQNSADDFITKPFTIEELIGKLRSGYRILGLQYEVQKEKERYEDLKVEVKEDYKITLESFRALQNGRITEAEKLTDRIMDTSVWIAKQLEDVESGDEIKLIEEAAKISLLGRITLNDTLLMRPIMNKGMTVNQSLEKAPAIGGAAIANISGLKDVGQILLHIYENFDGSGIPEKIKGAQIPIGARIIRVALDYEEAYASSAQNSGKAMETLYHECQRLYDHRVVAFQDQYLAVKSGTRGIKEKPVKVHELSEGMTLSRHIITYSGLVLLTANTSLNSEKISKITDIHKADPIIGKIYVRG